MSTFTHHEQAAQHLVFAAHHLLEAHKALQKGDTQKALYHAAAAEKHVIHAETHQTYTHKLPATKNIGKETLVHKFTFLA